MTIVNSPSGSRVDLVARTQNGFVTVGEVLATIEGKTMALEEIIAGNIPCPSMAANQSGSHRESRCICMRIQTPIDFYRQTQGAAGLVRSNRGSYTWEWRVGKLQ
jgi:hypothetical protein